MLGGRYRVVGLLGRGGMGEVYRADDLKLGQAVALKFLPAIVEKDAARLQRFLNEVKIARQISHPNVCRVYDVGEVDGHHYLSMEYVDGEDLSSLLRRIGRLPKDKAVQISRQLCLGLAAAHEQGILHRDLKPANVMIDGRGRARITDFGLATLAGSLRADEVGAGTPLYMAPEQRAGKEVTVRSDLYSLGLVLYELFTGQQAFKASTPAELARLQEESTPTSPTRLVEGLDPTVERAILRCLAKEPRDRPASAIAVAASLPGGDPLAAAIAAGETPSPEMVAAAGSSEGLRPAIAIVCLAGIALMMGLAVVLQTQTSLLPHVPLPKPPEVLRQAAREIVDETGSAPEPIDHEWGFRHSSACLNYIEREDRGPRRWDRLSTIRPPPIEFWLYQSPRLLEPLMQGWGVDWVDPPQTVPGSAITVLDPAGRLLELTIIPPEVDRDETPPKEPDWEKLFARAGLDAALLEPSHPMWNPLVSCDRREAWEGVYPDQPAVPIRVEAGAYRGKPVYFRVVPPWAETVRTAPVQARGATISGILTTVMAVLVLGVGAYLMMRNIRLGRGDGRGAFRIACVMFTLSLLANALAGHHVLARSELRRFILVASSALGDAGVVWMVYLALEPYVRRLWPQCLIAWSRLVAGRLRDPLVGRDILLGGAALAALQPLFLLGIAFTRWLGLPQPAPELVSLWPLRGLGPSVSGFLLACSNSFGGSLIILFSLLLLRVVLRRQWLAVTVLFCVTVAAAAAQAEVPWLYAMFAGLFISMFFLVLLRLGFVAAVSYMLLDGALKAPLVSDPSGWFSGRWLFIVGLYFALYAYAFYISLGGRPIFRGSILPE
jgi:serine/threonine-protein kinase